MLSNSAEQRFRRGLDALEGGRGLEALALFEAAIELERRHGHGSPQARYLSYYGLCLAVESRRPREGVRFCKQAIARESYNPDLYLNLGKAYLAAERRKEAWEVLSQGLTMAPSHSGILRQMERMGTRRRPALPFLGRSNPLNVAIGRAARAAEGDRSRKNGTRRS